MLLFSRLEGGKLTNMYFYFLIDNFNIKIILLQNGVGGLPPSEPTTSAPAGKVLSFSGTQTNLKFTQLNITKSYTGEA